MAWRFATPSENSRSLQPMPSMPLWLWGDDDGTRYDETYFGVYPGVWRQGDWATISERRLACIFGRSDSTLNRGGVGVGSAEIYAVVEQRDDVVDSLVVGVERSAGEYHMLLFVVLAQGVELDDVMRQQLGHQIRTELSPRHVPDGIVAAPGVPRTLTGKKLEVPVKRIMQGWPIDRAASIGAIDRPELSTGSPDLLSPARRFDAPVRVRQKPRLTAPHRCGRRGTARPPRGSPMPQSIYLNPHLVTRSQVPRRVHKEANAARRPRGDDVAGLKRAGLRYEGDQVSGTAHQLAHVRLLA